MDGGELAEKLFEWSRDLEDDEVDYSRLHSQLHFLDSLLFKDYEPALLPTVPPSQHLPAWLSSAATEAEQKGLLELLARVYFVGRQEFDTLYVKALETVVVDWLIDVRALRADTEFPRALGAALDQCWFCPITDSMPIARFSHMTGVKGRDYRPDWRSLAKFGDKASVESYCADKDIKAIVLLEDFIGTGKQAEEAVSYACSLTGDLQVLVCPLVICADGVRRLGRTVREVCTRSASAGGRTIHGVPREAEGDGW